LWWLDAPELLKEEAREAISDLNKEIQVSAAVLWEIASKRAIGKLDVSLASIEQGVERSGFTQLAITAQHPFATANLPSHHRDPFDRMLIAQSICEKATSITRDPSLQRYSIQIISA
jgi:PIN domain nuclease of toxin-antitoxin system